jgi:putative tricarboxylic transport membrane protein
MVPTLALGIPGSGTTAVILGGLLLHGLRPGPYLFQEQPTLLYSIFIAMLIANLLFLIFGLAGAKIFARVSLIPPTFLWPGVLALCIVGAYGVNQSVLDIYVMLLAGLIGFVLRRAGFAPAPIIMGLVLGTLVENSFSQSMIIFDQDWSQFLGRPIAMSFFLLAAIGLFYAPATKLVRRRWGRRIPAAAIED